MHLSEKFVFFIHPVLKRIFRCTPNVSYGILMGFLCGFPMGAKVAAQLYDEDTITKEEARFLLSFCNNIGPVYFCTFVIPTLNIQNKALAVSVMYGIPFLYGIILRYTVYRGKINTNEYRDVTQAKAERPSLLTALDISIQNSIASISMLCGYMIIFNLLNVIPHIFLPNIHEYIAPFLEITGGILISDNILPLYILILLPFGGLSCIAQTNNIIQGTSLSIKEYTLHKIILSGITFVFYLLYRKTGF